MILEGISTRVKWLALEERFSNTTHSSVMELYGKLQSLTMKDLSVIDYLLQAKNVL